MNIKLHLAHCTNLMEVQVIIDDVCYVYDAGENSKVRDIYEFIVDEHNIARDVIMLEFDGDILEDDDTPLSSSSICYGDTIQCVTSRKALAIIQLEEQGFDVDQNGYLRCSLDERWSETYMALYHTSGLDLSFAYYLHLDHSQYIRALIQLGVDPNACQPSIYVKALNREKKSFDILLPHYNLNNRDALLQMVASDSKVFSVVIDKIDDDTIINIFKELAPKMSSITMTMTVNKLHIDSLLILKNADLISLHMIVEKYNNSVYLRLKAIDGRLVNPDVDGSTYFHHLVKQNKVSIIKNIDNADNGLNATDGMDRTPIYYSTNADTLKILYEKGANLDMIDMNGLSVKEYINCSACSTMIDNILLDNG